MKVQTKKKIYISNSIEQTKQIGFQVAKTYLNDFDLLNLILVEGDLGLGKTTLIKGIISFFQIDEKSITSPTFAIKNSYQTSKGTIFHYDLYLIDKLTNENKASIQDDLANGLVIIEWPSKYPELMKMKPKLLISLFKGQNDQIQIKVNK